MPALGLPRAPQSSFLMRPGKGASCTGTATSSATCRRPRCGRLRPCSRRSTPARTSRQHARRPFRVIEKLRGLRLTRAAELVEAAIEETLAYYAFPEEHWRRAPLSQNRKIAVGTLITERPPHRSERAQLRHSAPTSVV